MVTHAGSIRHHKSRGHWMGLSSPGWLRLVVSHRGAGFLTCEMRVRILLSPFFIFIFLEKGGRAGFVLLFNFGRRCKII